MFALKKASHKWILYLDDDERLSRALKRDLRELIRVAEEEGFSAIATSRINIDVKGRVLLGPFYPDTQIRIYMKDRTIYSGIVHEIPKIKGNVLNLTNSMYYILHAPYQMGINKAKYRQKALFYAKLEALQRASPSFKHPIINTLIYLSPFTFPAIYLYFIAKSYIKGSPINLASLLGTIDLALYNTYVGLFMKIRNKRWKKYAEIISKYGFIELLGLDR